MGGLGIQGNRRGGKIRVWGVGYRVWGLGFGVSGFESWEFEVFKGFGGGEDWYLWSRMATICFLFHDGY